MSEGIQIGEFEVDPDTIPDPPKLPATTDLVFEVTQAERKSTEKEGKTSTRIDLRAKSVDLPQTPLVFGTLWITEQFKGSANKSFARFLQTTGLPYTTKAADLVNVRFIGQAAYDEKTGFTRLSKVVGAA